MGASEGGRLAGLALTPDNDLKSGAVACATGSWRVGTLRIENTNDIRSFRHTILSCRCSR